MDLGECAMVTFLISVDVSKLTMCTRQYSCGKQKECLRAEIQHSSEDIEPTHISILGKYCTDLAKWPIDQLCEHRAMAERPDLDDNSTQSRR